VTISIFSFASTDPDPFPSFPATVDVEELDLDVFPMSNSILS